jgi:hypothetical protein
MSNKPASARPCENRANNSTAKKLIQAAALAAMLVPLGSVAADAATINCVTSQTSGGFCQSTGAYVSGDGEQSNIWKFFTSFDGYGFVDLIYTLELAGTPTTTFSLDVEDVVTSQAALGDGPALILFPDAVCIPTYGAGQCGLFDVFAATGTPSWVNGYYATISWFTNTDPLSQPPDDGSNRILRAPDYNIFVEALRDPTYQPIVVLDPDDPALGGRGDSFSRLGAFTSVNVPEPGTLLLFGAGVAAALGRRRRRQQA